MKTSLKVLVTGAFGLIGRPLCDALKKRGHSVRKLSRSDRGDFQWSVENHSIDEAAVEGVDVIIHLAGETVAQRWTDRAKARILNSRVDSTKLLVDAILKQERRPALISASGISYYGIDRVGLLNEGASAGDGFLAGVTCQWEGAAQPLVDAGVRAVFLRTGIVLSQGGGALAKMLTPFKMGVGGRIGSGRQQMSWVSLPDLVAMYVFATENESVCGVINAVAPKPVSNSEFTKVFGKVLKRPTLIPLPTFAVKALFGEMGKEIVVSDLGVVPAKLLRLGFKWYSPDLKHTLEEALLT